jgi:hypothetical protein
MYTTSEPKNNKELSYEEITAYDNKLRNTNDTICMFMNKFIDSKIPIIMLAIANEFTQYLNNNEDICDSLDILVNNYVKFDEDVIGIEIEGYTWYSPQGVYNKIDKILHEYKIAN